MPTTGCSGPFSMASRVLASALGVAYGAVTVAVVSDAVVPTSYAETGTGLAVADLGAGLALILAGTLAWWERSLETLGPVALLLGMAWLAPDWVGWEGHGALSPSVAMVGAPFVLPLLVHVVMAAGGGRRLTRGARVLLTFGYGITAGFAVARALVRDPFLDPHCWSNCTDNAFLLHADPGLALALDASWLIVSVLASFVLVGYVTRRLLLATRPARSALEPVLVPAALAAVALAAFAIVLIENPAEDPYDDRFRVVLLARAVALALLGAGIAWSVARRARTRVAIARLAADLGDAPQPGSLQAALAASLGDPRLQVGYWLATSAGYVDADGRPLTLAPGDRRTRTPIVRDGEPVAIVVNDNVVTGTEELTQTIGAAARMAIDNERLRAEVLAQLEALRASRARIVHTGDAARRQSERDLHDGAQQRLLALSYQLRLARGSAEGDPQLSALLDEACDAIGAANAELRELAQGIHPVILSEAGLGAALASLVDTAPLPVQLTEVPVGRFPSATELTAHLVVSSAIEGAAHAGADHLTVRVRSTGPAIVVRVEGVPSAPPAHIVDRVGALGGQVDAERDRLTAEIPCE